MDEELGGSASAQGPKRLFQVTQPPLVPTRPHAMGPGRSTGMGGSSPPEKPCSCSLSPKSVPKGLAGAGRAAAFLGIISRNISSRRFVTVLAKH